MFRCPTGEMLESRGRRLRNRFPARGRHSGSRFSSHLLLCQLPATRESDFPENFLVPSSSISKNYPPSEWNRLAHHALRVPGQCMPLVFSGTVATRANVVVWPCSKGYHHESSEIVLNLEPLTRYSFTSSDSAMYSCCNSSSTSGCVCIFRS